MLYLVGIGLNEKGYSKESYEVISKAEKVYLESYTVDLPYNIKKLEEQFNKKFNLTDRNFIESLKFLDEAKKRNVVLLIYGSPLAATTHISIIQEAKKRKIKTKIIHSASVFDAVAETGLQLYKFGKIASMPNFNADSYINVVKENLKIKAHSLILIDMGLNFENAMRKLIDDCNKKDVKLDEIVACSRLGTDESKIYYGMINNLKSLKIKSPYCLIIPSKLHFLEKEFLESFKEF